MIGIHCFWSKPALTGTNGHHLKKISKYEMMDFELINFIISALMYKKYNDDIYLYTDIVFYNYLKNLNFTDFWDYIDTEKSTEFEKLNINSKSNWTSFKTWIVGQLKTPFLLIDHDNIICTPIPTEFFNVDVRFAHLEKLNKNVYPDKKDMEIDGFFFDDDWDWECDIPNTSILFFNNESISKIYSDTALKFEKVNNPKNYELSKTQYLFADQRLLMMILKKYKIRYGMFSNLCFTGFFDSNQWIYVDNDLDTSNIIFDHTWVYKHELTENYEARKRFMMRMSDTVKEQLPNYYHRLEKYFKNYYD